MAASGDIIEGRDAFTHFVMNKIDKQVLSGFSPEQLHAIEQAVAASTPLKRHAVDMRGTLPLFFTRFYFVFLMGRDRRQSVLRKELERRKQGDMLASVMFVLFVLSPLLLLALLALYFTKTELGLDLFPDSHLGDFLQLT